MNMKVTRSNETHPSMTRLPQTQKQCELEQIRTALIQHGGAQSPNLMKAMQEHTQFVMKDGLHLVLPHQAW